MNKNAKEKILKGFYEIAEMFQQLVVQKKTQENIFQIQIIDDTLNVFQKTRELEELFVENYPDHICYVFYKHFTDMVCVFDRVFVFKNSYVNAEKKKVYVYETNAHLINYCIAELMLLVNLFKQTK